MECYLPLFPLSTLQFPYLMCVERLSFVWSCPNAMTRLPAILMKLPLPPGNLELPCLCACVCLHISVNE